MPGTTERPEGRTDATPPPVAQIRETSKWLIGALGAVAAIIAASIQFGNLGRLGGSDLLLALVGAIAAFSGVAIAIYAIADLLLPRARTLTDLLASPTSDPALQWLKENGDALVPFLSLGELRSVQESGQSLYSLSFHKWQGSPTPANAQKLKSSAELLRPTEEVVGRIIDWANYHTLRADFARTLRRRVAIGVSLAALGLTLLAYEISSVSTSHPRSPALPEVLISDGSGH